MIKTYIIEDEKPTQDAIVEILKSNCHNIDVVGISDNVTEAEKGIMDGKDQ